MLQAEWPPDWAFLFSPAHAYLVVFPPILLADKDYEESGVV